MSVTLESVLRFSDLEHTGAGADCLRLVRFTARVLELWREHRYCCPDEGCTLPGELDTLVTRTFTKEELKRLGVE